LRADAVLGIFCRAALADIGYHSGSATFEGRRRLPK
jgi:hypothetical protein